MLSSGLDDYPRGLFVNPTQECHLDAHVWFMLLVDTMHQICKVIVNVPLAYAAVTVGGDKEEEESKLTDLQYSAHAKFCETYDYKAILAILRKTLQKNFYDADRKLFSDVSGDQPHTKKGRIISSPPWDGSGQCRPPKVECPVGQCCSPSGWCGDSPDYCQCEGCVSYKTPLRDRPAFAKNVKPAFSPHIGYVNLYPFLFGLENGREFAPDAEDNTNKLPTATLERLEKELAGAHGVLSLSEKDPLFGKGENYWRGKIWANLNYMVILRLTELNAAEAEFKDKNAGAEASSTKVLEKLAQLRGKFFETVEREFQKAGGNFYENFDPTTGEGRGAVPFTGWTAAAYVMLKADASLESWQVFDLSGADWVGQAAAAHHQNQDEEL